MSVQREMVRDTEIKRCRHSNVSQTCPANAVTQSMMGSPPRRLEVHRDENRMTVGDRER